MNFFMFMFSLYNFITIFNARQSLSNDNQTLPPLHFNILNKGESVIIPLDGYFPFANNYTILQTQSSPNITDIFEIQFNLNKIQVEASQPMAQQNIYLSQNRILDIKTVYNQPNKIFLLQKNIIMMYSYRQKSQQKLFEKQYFEFLKQKNLRNQVKNSSRITVVNISEYMKIDGLKNYSMSCMEMQALPLQGEYKLILLCKVTAVAPPQTRNYIVGFNMQRDNRGFITNLEFNSSNYIESLIKQGRQYINQNQNQQNQQNYTLFKKIIYKNILNNKTVLTSTEQFQQKISKYLFSKPIAQPPNCQQYHLKYFQKIVIEQKVYNHTVIAYCNSTADLNSNRGLYQVGFFRSNLVIKPRLNSTSTSVNTCFINSKYIAEYQNGFVSIKAELSLKITLRMYKYSHKINSTGQYQVDCSLYNFQNLLGYLFITSRNQSGVETIYVIFSDRIMIFESYSPNYQTLNITTQGLMLKSYAISNQILSLHFENVQNTNLVIMAYNIKAMYPHLIDRVQYPISKTTGIFLFSVMNYLQSGNYFFIYQRQRNILNLTYYSGQNVNISIKDPWKAVGNKKLAIMNTENQYNKNQISLPSDINILPIYFKVRAFCDTSIQIVQLQTIKLNSKLFNIDLVKAVLGPLGRFYKMSNPSSSLQFVNSFHQIDITDILQHFNDKKLMTFSIDTFFNDPILTFYFQHFLILQCDLQFDFYLMRPLITKCVQVVDTQDQQKNPEQIIIYDQGRFLQHQGHRIQFCRISSNRQIICTEGDFQQDLIKKIKLIKYEDLDDGFQFISIFIIFQHSFKQNDYIAKSNATQKSDIQKFDNLIITQNQIQYLKFMTIKTLQYDEEYSNFLLIYMMDYFNPVNNSIQCTQNKFNPNQNNLNPCLNQTFFHIVQIYSKPQLQRNQNSRFVGHLVQQFTSTQGQQLQNVFIIDNKILMLFINTQGSTIEQYKIEQFKCTKSRNYPLYDHTITKNGSHSINSGFLFVEVRQMQQQVSKYLVYNPSLNTTNIITNSFTKIQNQNVHFIQKITQSDNLMAIHGNNLITLSLPNMVIKLNQGKKSDQQYNDNFYKNRNNQQIRLISNADDRQQLKLSDSVNVSFIDNNDILRIISFGYSYDISDSFIEYNHHLPDLISFDSLYSYQEIQIDPTQITGPVSQYNIQNLTQISQLYNDKVKDICQYIQFNSSDIFTKTKCIKYINSKQDGIMQDFLTYQAQAFQNFTIIVTDKKILCIQNMHVRYYVMKSKTKDCNLFEQDSRVYVVCVQNNNTIMIVLQMNDKCVFNITTLQKPQILKYNLFKMVITCEWAIFQVPIRSQTNKVYYITKYFIQNKTFDDSLILLKHQSEQQFITKDFTTNDTFMFLLQNGLGIYNLSKNTINKKITPDVWITGQQLMDQFDLNQQLAYVNCLDLNYTRQQIILQIGTTFHSFQLHIKYTPTQSSISITSMKVHYTYKNPWSCYNTLLSKSRYYKDMTIKMCSYMPEQHYIFSNFIPISQNKQNSYIIFYEKNFQKNQSYPFRMDIIYTNIYSNDNFQIPMHKAKLLIGSLFNLLCQYDLMDSYKFNFTINPKFKQVIQDSQSQLILQKKCHFYLNLSNQNYQKLYNITIKLDFQKINYDYWTDWKHWIQRIFVILVIANYIRLQYIKKAQKHRFTKLKTKRSRSDSFDQQFDLQVRFNSKKSI